MKRPGWFETRGIPWWQWLALAPLVPCAWLYGAVAWGVRRVRTRSARRLSCRVVSVGNLVVGGSGKTPAAAWLAAQLRARGHKVAIASRGYGRSGREAVCVVSDGRYVRATAAEAGDEPLLLAGHAPGVPVLVGPDRGRVGLRAVAAFGADVLVLDDGMQHTRLARDVELVTFDGAAGLGNGWVLPRGPLRERLGSLRGADAFIVVDGPLDAADRERVAAWAPTAQWFEARRVPLALHPLGGGPDAPPDSLHGAEVGLLAGIARPSSLRRTVEALGARVVAERYFADHHRYREHDVARLAAGAPRWVTTEKDAVKILPRWVGGVPVDTLRIALQVERGDALLDWIERRMREARRYGRG